MKSNIINVVIIIPKLIGKGSGGAGTSEPALEVSDVLVFTELISGGDIGGLVFVVVVTVFGLSM